MLIDPKMPELSTCHYSIKLMTFCVHAGAHETDQILRELHVRLKTHVPAGTRFKHEAKVDVEQMSFLVDHDLAIVAILDLENVEHQTVGSHRLDVISALFLEEGVAFVAIFKFVEL